MSYASTSGEQLHPDELDRVVQPDRWYGDPQEGSDFDLILRTLVQLDTRELRELDPDARLRVVERVLDWAEAAGVRERVCHA